MYNDFNKSMISCAFQISVTLVIPVLLILNTPSFLSAQEQSESATSNFGYIQSQNIPEIKNDRALPATKKGVASKEAELRLNPLQRQARFYRFQGFEAQRIGDLEAALKLYQKAVEIDPTYSIVYNDLGVIYEALGYPERAEAGYLKSIKIDPDYLSPYTNLALLYENRRDLEKAAFYWRKRWELGIPEDPWTSKAKQRLDDILMVLQGKPLKSEEEAVLGLMKDIVNQKIIIKSDNRELAKVNFQKAKLSYAKGDEVLALKQALDAKELDPYNAEIDKFIEKVQTRLLTR